MLRVDFWERRLRGYATKFGVPRGARARVHSLLGYVTCGKRSSVTSCGGERQFERPLFGASSCAS